VAGKESRGKDFVTPPSSAPPTPKPAKGLIANIAVADTLLVIAGLILAFRWGKLGTLEIGLAVLFGIGAAYFFIKGIRSIFVARKPQKSNEPQKWKPIEP